MSVLLFCYSCTILAVALEMLVVGDVEGWYEALRRHGVPVLDQVAWVARLWPEACQTAG